MAASVPFALFVLLVAWSASGVHAQQAIPRFTIDTGGGTSTGGTFALSGTVGQPDAGLLGGGAFVLAGGFWFGGNAVSGVGNQEAPMSVETRILPIAPNPVRNSTIVAYTLARPEVVRIDFMDISGRKVRRLVDEPRPAGAHRVAWNGADDAGTELPSGVYFLVFTTGVYRDRQKVMLLR